MSANPPHLELLLDTLAAYRAGALNTGQVLEALEEIADHVVSYLNEFEELTPDPGDPEAQAIQQGFEEHLEALEELIDDLQNPGAAITRIRSALDAMTEARRGLLQRAEMEKRVLCPRCSQPSPRGSSRCSACSGALPFAEAQTSTLSVAENEAASEVLTEEFVRLAKAHQRWLEGEADQEALRLEIGLNEQALRQQLVENEALNDHISGLPEPFPTQATELAERSHQALCRSLEALDAMSLAFVHDDASYLENGLHQLRTQARELVRCHHLLVDLEKRIQGGA